MEGERRQERLNEYRRVLQPGCLHYEPEVYLVGDREAGKCMVSGRLWCGWAGLKQRDDTRWGPQSRRLWRRRGEDTEHSEKWCYWDTALGKQVSSLLAANNKSCLLWGKKVMLYILCTRVLGGQCSQVGAEAHLPYPASRVKRLEIHSLWEFCI